MEKFQDYFNKSIESYNTSESVPYCTLKLKHYERRKARISQGMSPEPDTNTERQLGLSYEPMPKIKTRAELKTLRKLNNSLHDTNISFCRYDTPEERLNKREEKYRVSTSNGQTLEKLVQQRKYENIEYHSKVFGTQKIGIHKNELPKFSKYKKNYWGRFEERKDFECENRVQGVRKEWKSFDKEVTKKPNETCFSPDLVRDKSLNYGKRFVLSKIQTIVLKHFKVYEDSEEVKPEERLKKRMKNVRDVVTTPQIQIRHIRSGGFSETKRY